MGRLPEDWGVGHRLTQCDNSLLVLEFKGSKGKRGPAVLVGSQQLWEDWDCDEGLLGVVCAPEASQPPLLP